MNRKIALAFALLPALAIAQQPPPPSYQPPPTYPPAVQQTPSAYAPAPPQNENMARVIAVNPIQGQGVQRKVCDAPAPAAQSGDGHSVGGAIVGGLGGALVGSRFGKGHGQDALTVAGAVGGALLGDRVGAGMDNSAPQQPACRWVTEPGPVSYQVTYDYRGVQNTNVMNYRPGEYVRIRRSISLDQ